MSPVQHPDHSPGSMWNVCQSFVERRQSRATPATRRTNGVFPRGSCLHLRRRLQNGRHASGKDFGASSIARGLWRSSTEESQHRWSNREGVQRTRRQTICAMSCSTRKHCGSASPGSARISLWEVTRPWRRDACGTEHFQFQPSVTAAINFGCMVCVSSGALCREEDCCKWRIDCGRELNTKWDFDRKSAFLNFQAEGLCCKVKYEHDAQFLRLYGLTEFCESWCVALQRWLWLTRIAVVRSVSKIMSKKGPPSHWRRSESSETGKTHAKMYCAWEIAGWSESAEGCFLRGVILTRSVNGKRTLWINKKRTIVSFVETRANKLPEQIVVVVAVTCFQFLEVAPWNSAATDGAPKEMRSLLCRERFQLRNLGWRVQTPLRAPVQKRHDVFVVVSNFEFLWLKHASDS